MAETEVLVVGSGPGGLAAGLSAARQGVDTILVDRYGCFGGNITQVGVESFAWYRHQGTTDAEGIGIEFEQRAKAMGGTSKEPQSESEALDAEMFKVVADTLVRESGLTPILHCPVVDAIVEDGTIIGVVTESKSGRQAIMAKAVIDATGDADVAHRSGAPYRKTPIDQMQAVTVVFSCRGVDKGRFLEYVKSDPATYKNWSDSASWEIDTSGKEDDLFSPYLAKPFIQAREDGLIPPEITSIGGTWSTVTDFGEATYLNMIHMKGYDLTDVWDLTRAEMEGRRQAILAIEALRRYTPGFENAGLRNFGMTVGARDTRSIIGRYDLTERDVRDQGRFDDSIGICPEFLDGYRTLVLPTTGRYFQVPYGIMVPRDMENLLVVGRCVAGDTISHAATRGMMCCSVTGQGAGVAAAVSVRDGVYCGNVDIKRVQGALEKQGARVF